MSQIRAGVIGLGIVAERVMRDLEQHPDVTITAVCDIQADRARQYAEKFQVPERFTDFRRFLQESDCDLVYVAVPPSFHAEIVMSALEAGKHVLCEKPLANSMQEAEDILQAAKRSGRVHAMHFPLQYSKEVAAFQHLYESGYIGTLRRVEVTMHFPVWPRPWQQNLWVGGREQGGFTLEVGVHFIQSIQRIFGPVANVSGQIRYPEDKDRSEIGLLATATVLGDVPVLFDGLSGAGGNERVEFTAYGTDGTLSLTGWSTLRAGKLGEAPSVVSPDVEDENMVDHVVRAIRGESSVVCDFQVGLEAQRVLEALRHQSS